jgi:hypothetical protein
MPILSEEHDFAHPVEGDSAWSESYYFNAYDPGAGVGFFSRIGVRPNEGSIDASCAVWLPGQELGFLLGKREQTEMIDRVLEVGDVRYEMLEPMKRWRLTASGEARIGNLQTGARRRAPVSVDVLFDALIPAIGSDGQGSEGQGASAEARKMTGKGHLEQAGRWTGFIEVDGERHSLSPEARGNRDKSWGPRRWGGPRMWRWFSINLGDDFHLGGIRIGTDAGDLHRGWVWKDGEHASIRDWDVRTELAENGLTQRVVDLRVTDKKDRVHALRGELLRVAPLPSERDGKKTLVNEGLARWTCEDRTGYGIAEYLHQLDANGRPVTPID